MSGPSTFLAQLSSQLLVYRERASVATNFHRWKLRGTARSRLAVASAYRAIEGHVRELKGALAYWLAFAGVAMRAALVESASQLGVQRLLARAIYDWSAVR